MWNPYENPWMLLFIAAGLLCIVQVIRWGKPQKNLAWLLILPIGTAALALTLDLMVHTDYEKISSAVRTLRIAAVEKDLAVIAERVHPEYTDPINEDPDILLNNIEHAVNLVEIEKIKTSYRNIQILRQNSGVASCEFAVHLNRENQRVAAPPVFLLTVDLFFLKNPQGQWLLTTIEPLKYNRQTISWNSLPR